MHSKHISVNISVANGFGFIYALGSHDSIDTPPCLIVSLSVQMTH